MHEKVKETLLNAKNNIAFYKDEIKTTMIEKPNEIMNSFYELPIVRKDIVKNNIKSFIHDDLVSFKKINSILDLNKDYSKEYIYKLPFATIVCEFTSGSSGIPFLSIKSDHERIILGKKLWQLRNQFSPINQKDFFNIIHSVDGKRYPFPFEPDNNEIIRTKNEIEYLESSFYKWWHCSNYRLALYCDYLRQNFVKFRALEVIENNGSFLSNDEINKYTATFKCKIANNYGCREIWTIAYDCPYGYFHINEDHVLLELIDENNKIIDESEQVGKVVITSLKQKFMPFIRYLLGDYAYYIKDECKCGCRKRRIALLPGRYIISGTNLYGNQVFRRVVLRMNLDHRITNYSSISVKQLNCEDMFINVKGNCENKEKIENAFIFEARRILGDKFNYYFTYYDDVEPKDIFISTNINYGGHTWKN